MVRLALVMIARVLVASSLASHDFAPVGRSNLRKLHDICDVDVLIVDADFDSMEDLTAACSVAASACLQNKTDAECAEYALQAAPHVTKALGELNRASDELPEDAPHFLRDFLDFDAIDVSALENVRTCAELDAVLSAFCMELPSIAPFIGISVAVALIVMGCLCCCFLMGCASCTACILGTICCCFRRPKPRMV